MPSHTPFEQAKRSVFDRVRPGAERLFGIPGELDEPSRTAGLRGGLLGLGTSLLKSTAPVRAGERGSTLSNIAEALEAAQAGSATAIQRQGAVDAQTRAREIANQFQGANFSDPRALTQLFGALASSGQNDAAGSVAEVLKSMQAGNNQLRLIKGINPETGATEHFRVGPDGVPVPLGLEAPAPAGAGLQTKVVVGAGGISELALFDPNTGQITKTGIQAPSNPGDNERRAEFFSLFLPTAEGQIEASGFNERAPDRIGTIAQEVGLREFTSDAIQSLHQAGNIYAEAWLRMTTGAAYNEREFETSFRTFVPMPGDSRATLQLKKDARQRMRAALNSARGRAAFLSGSGSFNQGEIVGQGFDTLNSLAGSPRAEEDELDRALDAFRR